jgi:hypothetical protein
MTKPVRRHQGWVGMMDRNTPYVESCTDEAGDCYEVIVYRTAKEALDRHDDVCEVTLTLGKRVAKQSSLPQEAKE